MSETLNNTTWGKSNNNRSNKGKSYKGKFIKKKSLLRREKRLQKNLCSVTATNTNSNYVRNPLLKGTEWFHPDEFSKQMWCNRCKVALSLDGTIETEKQGVTVYYKIKCYQCSVIKTVCLSKKFGDKNQYHVLNATAALGIIDSGIGESQFNSLCSAMDIAPLNPKTFKKYERIVGEEIESIALKSCIGSLEKEKSLTIAANDIVHDESGLGKIGITTSYDVGWQKRGTGRSYNSLSGQGALIGHYSKKVCSYAVRSKSCRKCSLGHSPTDHDCRLNYTGTSKGMEADMAVELYTKNPLFEKCNVFGARIVMDNDCSSICSLRQVSKHSIELWADKNHTVKAFSNSMWKISLPKNIIDYFSNTLSNVIEAARGNAELLEKKMRAIIPHAFGDHSNCDFHDINKEYVYKNLPGKKALNLSTEQQTALEDIMSRYYGSVHKIAPAASSQGNESLNSIVASKCPKSKHYSSSESLNFRVAAAIAQKNIGYEYVAQVYEKLKLNPLKKGLRYRELRQCKKLRNNTKMSSRAGKVRRKFLKSKRSAKATTAQRREGVSYESNIALSGIVDIPIEKPVNHSDDNEKSAKFKMIYVDTETTGLHASDQVVQIAAYDGDSAVYNSYIVPSTAMKPAATAVTGLTVKKGEMFHHGKKLQTVSREKAIQGFIGFLEKIKCDNSRDQKPCNIILVGHNILRFDAGRIERLAKDCALYDKYIKIVYGYSDTLDVFKKKLKDRVKAKLSFSEEALVKEYLPQENVAQLHDAIVDIKVLKNLIETVGITDQELKDCCKSIDFLNQTKVNKVIIVNNKRSLKLLEGVVKTQIINKMAKEGINIKVLTDAYKKDPQDGIRVLLSMCVNKKVRVTSKENIITLVYEKIKTACT